MRYLVLVATLCDDDSPQVTDGEMEDPVGFGDMC